MLQDEARYDVVPALSSAVIGTLRKQSKRSDCYLPAENVFRSRSFVVNIQVADGGLGEIYREGNQRYIAIKYSVRGRDLWQHRRRGDQQGDSPGETAYRLSLSSGRKENTPARKRANARLLIVLPITIFIIFVILYNDVQIVQMVHADHGQRRHRTHWWRDCPLDDWDKLQRFLRSRSFLALIGVSVQTGVIMLEYINQLRVRRYLYRRRCCRGSCIEAAPYNDATMLVATQDCCPRLFRTQSDRILSQSLLQS